MVETVEFDAPFFKVLAKNDSGEASSNQGGPVITRDIAVYTPTLIASMETPVPSIPIDAILMLGRKEVGRVKARYQLQTWKFTRAGEYRITRIPSLNLPSKEGDIFLIERGVVERDLYRLTLIQQGTDEYDEMKSLIGDRESGPLVAGLSPIPEQDLDEAQNEQVEREQEKFKLFDPDAVTKETRSKKVARSRAFAKLVSDYYEGKCALCGQGLVLPNGKTETESAHIVPRGKFGSDDARNGLALCRSHHWAFDKGMWGVTASGEIMVRPDIAALGQNATLTAFAGEDTKLIAPIDAGKAPDPDALAWHMNNVVNQPAVET